MVTLHLTVTSHCTTTREVTKTICFEETYDFYGETKTESGTYTHLVENAICDTIVTLTLTILPKLEDTHIYITITEGDSYTWHETDFNTTGDYSFLTTDENGCTYTEYLHLTVALKSIEKTENIEITIAEQCAGAGVLEIELQYSGAKPTSVLLHFSEEALRNGFADSEYMIEDDKISIPYNARAGRYSVEIQVFYNGELQNTSTHDFNLLFPSTVLEQGWMDAVFVLTHDYNGGYDFTDFQWYKDGRELTGEKGPYLYQSLTIGSEYAALLTEKSGLKLMTCPLVAMSQSDVSLYPTVCNVRQQLLCSSSELAEVVIFSSTGQRYAMYIVPQGESEMTAPQCSGIFFVRFHLINSNQTKTIKLLVE